MYQFITKSFNFVLEYYLYTVSGIITDEGTMYTCPECKRYSVFYLPSAYLQKVVKIEKDKFYICHNCSKKLVPEEDLLSGGAING